ncbi:MAG: hypothetical protein ABS55_07445 [Lautropia sp. SCN 70-15]|nr:MAG: hypothetical protein ABS55_07445 [Lautropia sp. SCN 70-15]
MRETGMTFPDITLAPGSAENAAPRPGASVAGVAHQAVPPGHAGHGADAASVGSRARERRLVDDIRRAEAWLADRQIGPIV